MQIKPGQEGMLPGLYSVVVLILEENSAPLTSSLLRGHLHCDPARKQRHNASAQDLRLRERYLHV